MGQELERIPSGEEAVEVFLRTVEGLLRSGVSCVTEYVVRAHRPEDLDAIVRFATALVGQAAAD